MAEVAHFVIPKELRGKAKKILVLKDESLSGYLRKCLEDLIEGKVAMGEDDKPLERGEDRGDADNR